MEENDRTAFHDLTPDRVISLVETALGVRCTNLFRPLNSYINRVYELEREDGGGLVAKFYRPGRWSKDALLDEHDFMRALVAAEVPIVAPLTLRDGGTLGGDEGLHFAVYPKKSGRTYDEYTDDQWLELGRLLGRVHTVGAGLHPRDRITMAPDKSTRSQVDYILAGAFIPPDLTGQFKDLTNTLIDEVGPMFRGCEMICIHGDCHISNLIYRPGESFYIIDFDDMAVGPPVQDFWMLLPGYRGDSLSEIDIFLEGYETFRRFDRQDPGPHRTAAGDAVHPLHGLVRPSGRRRRPLPRRPGFRLERLLAPGAAGSCRADRSGSGRLCSRVGRGSGAGSRPYWHLPMPL